MQLPLNRQNGIPLYIQLQNEIRKQIVCGRLKQGDKLPPERELAREVKVSRNTISMAYRELEEEGIIESTQGRGTFVANSNLVHHRESLKERVLKTIDLAIEDSAALGFSLDEFLAFTHVRILEKKELLSKKRVAFVECHLEQLEYFTTEVKLGEGVNIVPLLLEDLRPNARHLVPKKEVFDLVVTSLTHLEEVRKMFAGHSKVLGVALEPQVKTLVRLAKLPPGANVGVVCNSQAYSHRVREAVQRAGVNQFKWHNYLGKLSGKEVEALLRLDVVITCGSRLPEVLAATNNAMEILEFKFLPDKGSLNLIKSTLLECQSGD